MSGTITPIWTLGDRIRKARESSGLKQVDLAARLHVARSTIAGWENGIHRPSYSDLESIARACGVDPDWLETGISPDRDGSNTGYLWPDHPSLFDQRELALAV